MMIPSGLLERGGCIVKANLMLVVSSRLVTVALLVGRRPSNYWKYLWGTIAIGDFLRDWKYRHAKLPKYFLSSQTFPVILFWDLLLQAIVTVALLVGSHPSNYWKYLWGRSRWETIWGTESTFIQNGSHLFIERLSSDSLWRLATNNFLRYFQ